MDTDASVSVSGMYGANAKLAGFLVGTYEKKKENQLLNIGRASYVSNMNMFEVYFRIGDWSNSEYGNPKDKKTMISSVSMFR